MGGLRARVGGLIRSFAAAVAGPVPLVALRAEVTVPAGRVVPEEVAALRVLQQVTQRVHASLDLTDTLDAVARGVLEATIFSVVTINLRRPSGDFEVVSVEGSDDARAALLGQVRPGDVLLKMLARLEEQELDERWGTLLFSGHQFMPPEVVAVPWFVPDMAVSDDPEAWHPMDALFAPLVSPSGLLLGTLSVDVPRDGRLPSREQCGLLALFAEHAAIAVEHARMTAAVAAHRDEMTHAAQHDPLTGLANRALLMERGADAVAAGSGVGVVVVDLDGFKAVNDTFGHRAGDDVLRVLAARMRACARAQDLVARTGGDEFAVVVPLHGGMGPEVLPALADRLRRVCSEPVTSHRGCHQVGASVGTAVFEVGSSFEETLAVADDAMFADKRSKRSPQDGSRSRD
ncbi:sensor domain-containing diguanylate cyclase [Rhodococcus antarcticus]|uniref:Sensor domain-containing diguanylate cyclase n=1 Tax=Rhodococcus antarcticus TaxID=2987751 RepID=A0ABY6P0E3_9NOCA|nr:sensor domain-containing diguanylate cyclase [Rhodococcus antarcticus]UZJ24623.1 sensor domain-containing diguanylate cyclase [Rhodococcus antarcticus]